MKAIIIGGGIGGLSLALMLHARGIAATVYEQASEIREVGVGINTLPHAIRELAELGLLPALDAVAIRTRELIYMNRFGQTVWRELRGLHAGAAVPQFSIHRGRLQGVIRDAVIERLGPEAIRTGRRLQGFLQDEGGVTAHFADARLGEGGETARADILIGADGIHSTVRAHYFPNQGGPRWNGVQMWRGACDWPAFLDGESMIIAGGMAGKLVLYPIAAGKKPGTRLTNWVVNVRTGDPAKPLVRLDVPGRLLKLDGSPRDINAHDARWGYRYDQAFQFVDSIRRGESRTPTLADGVRCQAVLDAVLASSESRKWVEVQA